MKIGRPRLPDHRSKSEVIQFRVTKTEKNTIERVAKSMNLTVSEWFRAAVGLNQERMKEPIPHGTGSDNNR